MTENDIKGAMDALKCALRPEPAEQVAVAAGLRLLEAFLIGQNRIAEALEVLANEAILTRRSLPKCSAG